MVGVDLCLRRNDAVAFVMPYVPHDRFHDYFDKMTARELQSYMRNICIALKRVHSFGIIHRDVKPSNFLHDRKNQKYLLVDFGLAQNVNNSSNHNSLVVAGNINNNNNNNVDSNYSTKLPIEAMTTNNEVVIGGGGVGGKRKASAIDDNETDDCNSSSNIAVNVPVAMSTDNNINPLIKRPRYNNSSSIKSQHHQGDAAAAQADIGIGGELPANAVASANTPKTDIVDNDENALPLLPSTNNNNNVTTTTTIPSPFKQPLKQSNDNVATSMTPKNTMSMISSTGMSVAKGKQSSLDSPLTRHIKSAVLGYIMNAKIEKQRNQQLSSNNNNAQQQQQGPVTGTNNNNNNNTTVTNKYNNNSQLTANNNNNNSNKQKQQQQQLHKNSQTGGVVSGSNTSSTTTTTMCCCYGKPTVCNICIVKKEIHATRAGTPGYRPPEVLLKYPNQTTAVDMWAIGVIMITILSNCYPFFKGTDDFSALAEMITVFGDDAIKKTARLLARNVCVSHKKQPLHLQKLCLRLRNGGGGGGGGKTTADDKNGINGHTTTTTTTTCDNCQQITNSCLCANSKQNIDFSNDIYPASAYDLMAKLLEIDPSNRISAANALEHPFFREELL